MKIIQLTQGQVAIVDDDDFEKIGSLRWHACWSRRGKTFYAHRNALNGNGKRTIIQMHRVIMGATDPNIEIDHKNHDTLDNRKENLRACSGLQNKSNRSGPQANSTSGVRGVYWHKRAGKWMAQIKVNKKHIYLGLFDSKDKAAEAYASANREHFGEFGGNII